MSQLSDYQRIVERPQNAAYEARIAQLERDLAEARAERDRLKAENHDLGNEIDSLEEEGCATDDTIRKLEAERDRLAAEVERLRNAGAPMANILFNVSQLPFCPPGVRASMMEAQVQWDAARASLQTGEKGE